MSILANAASAIRERLTVANTRSGSDTGGALTCKPDWRTTPGLPFPEGVTVVDLADSPNHQPGGFVLPDGVAEAITRTVDTSPGGDAEHRRPITGATVWFSFSLDDTLQVRRGLVWDTEVVYDGKQVARLLEEAAPPHVAEATHHCLWGHCFR
jgi:hypothetical protein